MAMLSAAESDFREQPKEENKSEIRAEVDSLLERAREKVNEVSERVTALGQRIENSLKDVFAREEQIAKALRQESVHTFEQLPEKSQWPAEINDLETAQKVVDMFARCEQLTIQSTLKVKEKYDMTSRTDSNAAPEIIEWLENGGKIVLQDIPISHLDTKGSHGSVTRKNYVTAAFETHTEDEVFDRLPPVLVTNNKFGDFVTLDGNTRCMLAAQHGRETVRGYVLVNDGSMKVTYNRYQTAIRH